ncbi:hypothetical protein ACO2J1_02220 [Leptospira interrogans]|uniref:Uncharacterized protein n=9 Tax=Leptospira interrogans TaxID=173 RepID=Q8F9K3_LEPIN|nr:MULTISPECIES: hypothetical protein [Leptospira]APH40174.1 Uncharacterized protein A9P81_0205 [Leptospira interrogans serovar Copenhageni/Icterohaemorrhagiae]EMF43416.1 hypothetical protein LEP1GSC067_1333 [Leptospira interrogans serovar Lora str. TE 1992]EMF72445.1 hypothetical protein LEP1GSC148_3192 [Leptospira interrogans serovar Canicola str. LT1962]EMM83128.1 hypothetical protein LEP1GSC037_2462 [Leptospira interrogans str. 2006001854]EMM94025.1 hypothetical protein LEP1GSC158_4441 [Le
MTVNLCVQCNQNESMRQTDLCEECLIQNFKPLISLSDKIRSFHANNEKSALHEEPKGAA